MIQVSKVIPQGRGLASALLKRAATVELDWDVRQKSRFAATDSTGRELGIFLPRGTVVRGGDVSEVHLAAGFHVPALRHADTAALDGIGQDPFGGGLVDLDPEEPNGHQVLAVEDECLLLGRHPVAG